MGSVVGVPRQGHARRRSSRGIRVAVAAALIGAVTGFSSDFPSARGAPSARLGSLAANYAATVLADGPAAYWRLGESSGTTATDATGHGFNSTYYNGVSLGASGAIGGDSNTAASFDGVDDRVNGSVVTTQVSGVTLEAWVNWDGTAGSSGEAPMIVYNGHSGQNGYGLMIDVGVGACNGGGQVLIVLLGNVNCRAAYSDAGLPVGQWTYVVATRSGS